MSKLISGLENLSVMQEIDYAGWPSPFDDSGVQYAWDSVSLGLLKECPRKYQLSIVLNWQPKQRSHHLDFGIYYHTAIEHWLKLKAYARRYKDRAAELSSKLATPVTPSELSSDEAVHEWATRSAIRKAMEISFGYETGLKKGVPDKAKTREMLIRALVWYFERYRNDNCVTHILENGKPAVELSFRFEIGNDQMLAGHLDHIVHYGDGLYVQDHKTTGSTVTGASAKYFFSGFNPDNQMTLYSTAASIAFHTPVRGVMIDAAQLAVGFVEFARDLTHRTEAHLVEFLEGVYGYRRMAEAFHKAGFWPMNEKSCGMYGGCAFREICARSPQVREKFLRTDFTQDKPWNPLEPR